MNNHRYILEPYNGKKTRFTCPQCGKYKEFARYIDTETDEYVAEDVGRCNREQKCGYHYKPHQYFEDNNIEMKKTNMKPPKPPKKKTSYIDRELIEKAMRAYEMNKFAQFLEKHFSIENIYNVLKDYYVGTSNHWQGATVFPQIDTLGRVRTAKLMQYDPDSGKRIKEPHNRITWLHSVLKIENFNLEQCTFGEHLIPESDTVCIVESEKTCIIAALTWPQYTWIATGGKNGAPLKPEIFEGKKVILFPDLGVDWSDKAEQVGGRVSNVLTKFAAPEDVKEGYDLADYVLRPKPKQSENKESRPEPTPGEKAFEQMAAINPNLRELRERLDLTPGKVTRHEPMTKEQLKEVAVEAIGYNSNKLDTEIPYFKELKKQGIIKYGTYNRWYINGSTPF